MPAEILASTILICQIHQFILIFVSLEIINTYVSQLQGSNKIAIVSLSSQMQYNFGAAYLLNFDDAAFCLEHIKTELISVACKPELTGQVSNSYFSWHYLAKNSPSPV